MSKEHDVDDGCPRGVARAGRIRASHPMLPPGAGPLTLHAVAAGPAGDVRVEIDVDNETMRITTHEPVRAPGCDEEVRRIARNALDAIGGDE